MTSEHHQMETKLAELADHLNWPEADVSEGVRQQVLAERLTVRRLSVRWKVAVAALWALVVILAVPTGRQAIADLLGVAGIEVTFIDDAPDPGPIGLELGESVSLQYATDRINFPMSLPRLAEIGTPASIYLEDGPPIIVHAVWGVGPDLPEVEGTGIGLLLTQFESPTDQTIFTKELPDSTTVDLIAVGDDTAQWIEGAPHQLTYRTIDGNQTREVSRLAGNVLIWEGDGVTYRLETALDLEHARRIANAISLAAP